MAGDQYFGFDLLQRKSLQSLIENGADSTMTSYMGFNTTQAKTLENLLGGGGGGLPSGASGLGVAPITMPEVEEGFGSVPLPEVTVYATTDGQLVVNPPEATITWSAIPAGAVPGYDGAVSIESNTDLVGVTAGTALVGLSVTIGNPGDPGNQSLQLYLPVEVVEAP